MQIQHPAQELALKIDQMEWNPELKGFRPLRMTCCGWNFESAICWGSLFSNRSTKLDAGAAGIHQAIRFFHRRLLGTPLTFYIGDFFSWRHLLG